MSPPRTPPDAGPLRREAATVAVRSVAALSRRLGLGSGSTVGGRVGLALDPGLLAAAGAGRTVALVSGTNGKTTTTRLLAAALGRAPGGDAGGVATSRAGANLPPGLVSALVASPHAPLAALEVDERYLGEAARALAPSVVVLLNLSRDQLDRVSEVRRVAARWREALEGCDAVVVANADDPLVVWAAGAARRTCFVAAGASWRADAHHCPACGARLAFAEGAGGGWSCACGLRRPESRLALVGDAVTGPDETTELRLALPGRFNQANAALAAAAATVVGVPLADAVAAMRAVTDVAGRYATFQLGPARLRLLLAKNPAGFDELLGLVAGGEGPVVLAVNAKVADGHDPSWLWDVPFERLAGRHVVAGGERRLDVAVRLRHAGVHHEVAADPLATVAALASQADGDGRPVDVIANYTAFQQLRRRLERGTPRRSPGRLASRPPVPATGLPTPPARPSEGAAPGPRSGQATSGQARSGQARSGQARSGRARSEASALRVVVVHPDLLGTYGDTGNGLVLANRARWRGLPAELLLAPSDRPLPEDADLYCIGGGEDGPQGLAADLLAAGSLARAVERGAVVLAVCAGFQILGSVFPGADGRERPGLGLLEVESRRTDAPRAVGELLVAPVAGGAHRGPPPDGAAALAGLEPLTGFENHAARTRRAPGVAALGRVLAGTGNDGADDGALQGRVVGTYLHGPVLARNPALADALLRLALGAPLAPLDDEEEAALRTARLAAISSPRRPRPRVV